MQSTSVGEYKPEMAFRDGAAHSGQVASATSILGGRARDARSAEQRKKLLGLFEQWAQRGAGRRAADAVLGLDFIHRLTVDSFVNPAIDRYVSN